MTEYIITVDEAKAGFDGNMPISAKQEVVRCRDCKHHEGDTCVHWIDEYGNSLLTLTKPTDFCSWGERHAD